MSDIIDPGSVDRPNSYIGRSVPRPNAKYLVEGHGRYVDDIVLPRMVHVAFVRSPHAHARMRAIDGTAALALPAKFNNVQEPACRCGTVGGTSAARRKRLLLQLDAGLKIRPLRRDVFR